MSEENNSLAIRELSDFIELLDLQDRALLELPINQLDLSKGREAVDNVKRYFDALTGRKTQVDALIKQLKSFSSALDKKLEQSEEQLAEQMAQSGSDRLPGNSYSVSWYETEAVDTDKITFTPEFVEKWKAYVKVSYELSKSTLKPDLKEGIYDIPFARIKRNKHLRFTLKG